MIFGLDPLNTERDIIEKIIDDKNKAEKERDKLRDLSGEQAVEINSLNMTIDHYRKQYESEVNAHNATRELYTHTLERLINMQERLLQAKEGDV